MRNSNIVENSGIVLRGSDGAALGSCFLYRYVHVILTAAHVVIDLSPDQIFIQFPNSRSSNKLFSVKEIIPHPKADLAIITIDPPHERDVTWVHTETWDDKSYGLDLHAFGFSEDSDFGTPRPVARLFKGHVQRFFEHVSYLKYKYNAVELSFPCPRGLSGSALLNPILQGRLYGIVTENRETATEIGTSEYTASGGETVREITRNMVNYGIAIWLPSYADWLDSHIPVVSAEEIARRSENQQRWNIEEGGR